MADWILSDAWGLFIPKQKKVFPPDLDASAEAARDKKSSAACGVYGGSVRIVSAAPMSSFGSGRRRS